MTPAVFRRFKIIGSLLMLMLAVHVANIVLPIELRLFGIYPRELDHLPYIFSAPFLHADWMHLANNAIGFSVFSFLCLLHGSKMYFQVSSFVIIVSGLMVWAFARESTHIGASGWIFGLWSFSIALAWFDRSPRNILVALLVAVFYGGMVFGVLPTKSYISFEAHLFGAVSGAMAAGIYSKRRRYYR